MLREDKTARIELIKGATHLLRQAEPDRYEFSVGKYTRSGNPARTYYHVFLTPEEKRFFETQLTQPVLMMTREGTQWWWYLNHFWRDDESLSDGDVQALVLQRERKKQAALERARAGVVDVGEAVGEGSAALRRRLVKEEERERRQRHVENRVAEVERLNADLDATISSLEHLLAEALAHDPSVDFEMFNQRADAREEKEDADLDQLRERFEGGDPEAIGLYFSLVLESSPYPDGFPMNHRVAFVPESRQLVVEYELPSVTIVPSTKAYRYVKARDAIEETARAQAQTRALYGQVVALTALRTLHELFHADRGDHLETIVLNCYVDTTDPATGRPTRPHLVTVRTSKETFESLDLRRVDPFACLRGLNAGVSRSPHELLPVRPILEFDMVDPRFIQESDVLTSLDQRPNLMELTPKEFESLISNLFEKMGLDTRQTQASRDGGVDCVAYDPRPIFGGKVIIQAKRYKNTVGVSAVRDLFGTMQNEGASKGILVTTSGYGKSSFEFASGKPLELLSGSNLLYLLAEHAGIEARIEPPEDWVDPIPDLETDEAAVSPPPVIDGGAITSPRES